MPGKHGGTLVILAQITLRDDFVMAIKTVRKAGLGFGG